MFYRRNPHSATQRYRENPVHKCRFAYRIRGVENPRSSSKHRRETFHPDFPHTYEERAKSRPARVRGRSFFYASSSLCAHPRKKQAPTTDAFTRSGVRSCAHTSSRPFPSSTSVHVDVQPRHTRVFARAPRPRRQVPFTHTLASQTDSQLESNILK